MELDITRSSLTELEGVLVEEGELDFTFITDLDSKLTILLSGGNLSLVVNLTSVGGAGLELVGFEGTVNVVVRKNVVGCSKTG